MKAFIINGAGGCGKDTFIKYFTEVAGSEYVLNISTVDYIKKIAHDLGWKEQKDNKSRKFLSDLKDMATFWADIPFQDVTSKSYQFNDDLFMYGVDRKGFIFIHCREPEEIERLRIELKLPVFTLLIRRAGHQIYGNHADDEVENYHYNFIIENDEDLQKLKEKAINFYNMVK